MRESIKGPSILFRGCQCGHQIQPTIGLLLWKKTINSSFFVSAKLPHKVKIVVAGNHELGFEDGEEMSDRQLAGLSMLGINKAYDLLTKCIYLCDRQVEVGIFFGEVEIA
jgi:hypothetical protein